mgnify:CR=1 FL=1|jgi:hypothetical protein
MSISFGETEFSNGPSAFAMRVVLSEGPLGVSWQHASATCEFLGDMFATRSAKQGRDYTEARHSIIYLVNELLENAIKFRSPGDIELDCSLDDGTFELTVTNHAREEVAERFQSLLAEVTTRDPGELLIERIEANAADENSSGSGLGLLTLMNDYGARLGWNFRPVPAGGAVVLSTRASLTLN